MTEQKISQEAQPSAPIDMVLHCPACGLQHIDRDEAADFVPAGACTCAGADSLCECCIANKEAWEELWRNPPHRSHKCAGCGHIWRPADVPTNGVAAVKTKGKADSPLAQPSAPAGDAVALARTFGDVTTDSRGRETFEFDNYGIALFAAALAAREGLAAPAAVAPASTELPDDIRVPLGKLWADAAYLIGRVIEDPSWAAHAVSVIKGRVEASEVAVRAALAAREGLAAPAAVAKERADLVAAWNDLPDTLRCHPGLKRLYRACQSIPDAAPPASPAAQPAEDAARWQKAVQEAYGHLWHVNNEPMAPVPIYRPEKAAYEARKCLRELLTHEQRGEAINAVRGLLENKVRAAPPGAIQRRGQVSRRRFRWTRERYRKAHHLNRLTLRLGFYRAPDLVERWFDLWRQHPAACGSDPLEIPLRARLRNRRNPDDDIPF